MLTIILNIIQSTFRSDYRSKCLSVHFNQDSNKVRILAYLYLESLLVYEFPLHLLFI